MAKRKGGERTGKAFKQLQLPDVATSVFRLLEEKKKIPTPPNHTTPLPLSDTKFQDPEKTPKCFFILLGKRVGDGVSVSSAAGVGSGHTGKISLRTRTPAVFSGVIREPSFQRVGGGRENGGLRPKVSERLVGSAGLGFTGSGLADDAVRVLAAASGTAQAVVAMLCQLHAACGGQVAEQAGQHQREGTHEGPAGTAV